ncbi:MAG: imidazole glycerol phosphate synthase subunit HisH [Pseudomonadota bacterium]
MSVVIVDYGMGNIGSVTRALEECGVDVDTTCDSEELLGASHIVLPGVGAFPDGMAHLKEKNTDEALREAVKKGVPVLGICLGMQLLSDESDEINKTSGLGLIPGNVVKMNSNGGALRVPHVGWNEAHFLTDNPLFIDIPNASDFYFVHSFHYVVSDQKNIAAETPYGINFSSIIAKDNVFGVQFHPEKSSLYGLKMIKNFVSL